MSRTAKKIEEVSTKKMVSSTIKGGKKNHNKRSGRALWNTLREAPY